MGKQSSFDQFRDDFLIFAASKQNGESLTPIGVHYVSVVEFPNIPDAWKSEVVQMLERSGFGGSVNSGDDQEFYINGDGLVEAERVRASRTIWGKVKSRTFENWMSLIAIILSVIALWKN